MKKLRELTPGQKVVLVAALIGGLAAILSAGINFLGAMYQTDKPILISQTAEAKFTAVALTSTHGAAMLPPPSPTYADTVNLPLAPARTPTPAQEESLTAELPASATAVLPSSATSTQAATPTAIQIIPLAFDSLFRQCNDNKFLNGKGILFVNPGCDNAQKDSAIQLVWKIPDNQSDVGCTVGLDAIAAHARRNTALVFWARANTPNEKIAIKLKDDKYEESKLVELSSAWQQVALNLAYDFPSIDPQKIQALTIGIDYDSAPQSSGGAGDACFKNFGFGTP
jgi:hypothetical protein